MLSAVRRRADHLVRRLDADHYLFLVLLGFGGSIVVTRLYLELTGYPTVGGDTLHIAHAVWGGLLLFVGGMLPLVLANRSALPVAGSSGMLLSGANIRARNCSVPAPVRA